MGEEEEEDEVGGRCWVRRAAMRDDVKSWTCVRISRPIIWCLLVSGLVVNSTSKKVDEVRGGRRVLEEGGKGALRT